jgi:hypothetical protein
VFNVATPVWLSLAFFLLVTTISGISVFRDGLQLWRTFRIFGQRVDGATAPMAASAERYAALTAALGTDTARLEAATARLRVTLARFAVLRTAFEDVHRSVGAVTAFYPRK